MLTVNRLAKSKDGQTTRDICDGEIAIEMSDPERVLVLRKRLASISTLMQALCEHVALRANREDGCSGHFWNQPMSCVPPLRWMKLELGCDFACAA